MSVRVLIISNLYDFATDEVVHLLETAGVTYLRLNREQLHQHHLTLDPMGPSLVVDGPAGSHLVDQELQSVLFRQPVFLRNSPSVGMSALQQLERSQWQAFLQGLCVFDHARWMNYPAATYRAESKPLQLATAAACGFQVPHTIVGNDAARIHETLGQEMVIKSVDTVLLREGNDSLFTYTSLNPGSDLSDETLQLAPVIAQELLGDKVDLRVTIVGDQIFAVRILENGAGIYGDWRRLPKSSLGYVDVRLDNAIVESSYRLMDNLGLVFGAIDLALTPEGTFFLEINPTGEWGWLSTPDRPIGAAIASWLADPQRREKAV